MIFQEPKVELIEIKVNDVIRTSGGTGQEIDICTGNDSQDCSGGAV